MKRMFKLFFWVWFPIVLLGLLTGTLNLWNPKAVYIPNGEPGPGHEGIDGVIAAVLSSAVLGVFIGLVALVIAWLIGSGMKKLDEAEPADHRPKKDGE